MAEFISQKLKMNAYVQGSNGRGITGVTNKYYASSSNDLNDIPDTNDSRWLDNVPTSGDGTFNETNKYLWNFEVITYTDGTNDHTERTMIGVYSKDGKGIKEIIEYYALSETNTSPEKLPKPNISGDWPEAGEDNIWTKKIQETSQTQRYLWNYEVINYTEGEDTTSGPVCIGVEGLNGESEYVVTVSNDFINIAGGYTSLGTLTQVDIEVSVFQGTKSIFSFEIDKSKIQNNHGTASIWGDWDKDNNKLTITFDADLNKSQEMGTILFEVEIGKVVIKKEINYKIHFTTLPEISLELSNDSDIVAVSDKVVVGDLPKVVANVYQNSEKNESAKVVLKTYPAAMVEGIHFTYSNNTLKIENIPTNFSNGNFIFEYTTDFDNITITKNKTFSLAVVNSEIDYNLFIEKSVINPTNDGSFYVKVQKTTSAGIEIIETPGNDIQIFANGTELRAYFKDGSTAIWEPIKYSKGQKESIKIDLKVKGATWDTEYVEFVNDGVTPTIYSIIPPTTFFRLDKNYNIFPESGFAYYTYDSGDGPKNGSDSLYWVGGLNYRDKNGEECIVAVDFSTGNIYPSQTELLVLVLYTLLEGYSGKIPSDDFNNAVTNNLTKYNNGDITKQELFSSINYLNHCWIELRDFKEEFEGKWYDNLDKSKLLNKQTISLLKDGEDGIKGDSSIMITAYRGFLTEQTNFTDQLPSANNLNNWRLDKIEPTWLLRYIYVIKGTQFTSGIDNSVTYAWDEGPILNAIYGTTQEYVKQLNIFNELTQNGDKQGLSKDEEGNIYINASWIQSGTLSVKDRESEESNPIFEASITTGKTQMGGWEITPNEIKAQVNRDIFTLGSKKSAAQFPSINGEKNTAAISSIIETGPANHTQSFKETKEGPPIFTPSTVTSWAPGARIP